MTEPNRVDAEQWPLQRVMILAAVCLAIGLTGGWFIRGLDSANAPASAQAAAAPAAQQPAAASDPAKLKAQADAEAAPFLAQLQSDPANADILTKLGNLYYDAQDYPKAVTFYGKALAARPEDASVRTDLGTAYWYLGNADSAIAEFNTALKYQPDNPNTLFNRGLVRWQGKQDRAGALADWKKLLAANPNYEARDKVQQMMSQVQGR